MSQSAETLPVGTALDLNVRKERRALRAKLPPSISGAALVLGGTLVWQASNFVFNAVGAHALGPARYGVLAASVALLNLRQPSSRCRTVHRQPRGLLAGDEYESGERENSMLRFYGFRVVCAALALAGIAAAATRGTGLFHLGFLRLVVIVGASIPETW